MSTVSVAAVALAFGQGLALAAGRFGELGVGAAGAEQALVVRARRVTALSVPAPL